MAESERLKGLIDIVFIIRDGIRGHINQSRGVAHFLSLITGCDVHELEVRPDFLIENVKLNWTRKPLYPVERFCIMKMSAKKLAGQDKRGIFRW
ncbi:MAG: hypothetical protein WBI50_08715, partial [Acetomicrobium sp.]